MIKCLLFSLGRIKTFETMTTFTRSKQLNQRNADHWGTGFCALRNLVIGNLHMNLISPVPQPYFGSMTHRFRHAAS